MLRFLILIPEIKEIQTRSTLLLIPLVIWLSIFGVKFLMEFSKRWLYRNKVVNNIPMKSDLNWYIKVRLLI